jgi:hypothetical protein
MRPVAADDRQQRHGQAQRPRPDVLGLTHPVGERHPRPPLVLPDTPGRDVEALPLPAAAALRLGARQRLDPARLPPAAEHQEGAAGAGRRGEVSSATARHTQRWSVWRSVMSETHNASGRSAVNLRFENRSQPASSNFSGTRLAYPEALRGLTDWPLTQPGYVDYALPEPRRMRSNHDNHPYEKDRATSRSSSGPPGEAGQI